MNMKIQFYIHGFKDNPDVRHWLQQPLERLASQVTVHAAVVVVQHDLTSAPPFRASALLAVPGPDIHADAQDHTFEAVWLKVTASLRKQIGRRKARQVSRVKRNGHVRRSAVVHGDFEFASPQRGVRW
jgi:hypothetical protein